MKYEPKHMADEKNEVKKPAGSDVPDDGLMSEGSEKSSHASADTPDGANIAGVPLDDQTGRVHPWGIPVPDPGDGAEYIPIAGDNRVSMIAPNGAVVRNPWSEQPEIKPDYEYTDEKEDLNLLIM